MSPELPQNTKQQLVISTARLSHAVTGFVSFSFFSNATAFCHPLKGDAGILNMLLQSVTKLVNFK